MEEVQMRVVESRADELVAIIDNGRGGRSRGDHIVGLADRDDTVTRDGNRQLTGGIDAVLGGKDVLGADNPIDMGASPSLAGNSTPPSVLPRPRLRVPHGKRQLYQSQRQVAY